MPFLSHPSPPRTTSFCPCFKKVAAARVHLREELVSAAAAVFPCVCTIHAPPMSGCPSTVRQVCAAWHLECAVHRQAASCVPHDDDDDDAREQRAHIALVRLACLFRCHPILLPGVCEPKQPRWLARLPHGELLGFYSSLSFSRMRLNRHRVLRTCLLTSYPSFSSCLDFSFM